MEVEFVLGALSSRNGLLFGLAKLGFALVLETSRRFPCLHDEVRVFLPAGRLQGLVHFWAGFTTANLVVADKAMRGIGACCWRLVGSRVFCGGSSWTLTSVSCALVRFDCGRECRGGHGAVHYARGLMTNVWASSSWQRGQTRYKCLRGQASISTCRGLLLAALLLVAFVSFVCRVFERFLR